LSADLENTKQSILPVCDKPYHKIKENMGRSLKIVELSITIDSSGSRIVWGLLRRCFSLVHIGAV